LSFFSAGRVMRGRAAAPFGANPRSVCLLENTDEVLFVQPLRGVVKRPTSRGPGSSWGSAASFLTSDLGFYLLTSHFQITQRIWSVGPGRKNHGSVPMTFASPELPGTGYEAAPHRFGWKSSNSSAICGRTLCDSGEPGGEVIRPIGRGGSVSGKTLRR